MRDRCETATIIDIDRQVTAVSLLFALAFFSGQLGWQRLVFTRGVLTR